MQVPEDELMRLPVFRYYYSVADKNGFPVSRYRMVTGNEFLKITGIHPLRRPISKEQLITAQPELYRASCVA